MKASELIKLLEQAVKEHGDHPVAIIDTSMDTVEPMSVRLIEHTYPTLVIDAA